MVSRLADTGPATQLLTTAPDGSSARYLGRIGPVANIVYGDTLAGGPEQLTCTVQADPSRQDDALAPGRLVRGIRGASIIWEGTLDQPVPGDDGWELTASGAGTWGSKFRAVYTSWTGENVIDTAISNGLRWIRGTVSGGYLAEPRDSASISVTEFLNLITSPGSKTWHVTRTPAGLKVNLIDIPTTPTRILITDVPSVRTLAGYINVLRVRYQATADTGSVPATYGLAVAYNPDAKTKYGVSEQYWDLSPAGVITYSAAGAYGVAALNKYTDAFWGSPLTISPGQYLTMGGVPVDLGCEKAGEVARLVLADGPYSGQLSPTPVTFPVGKISYNNSTGTAQVTPFQSVATDWSSLLDILAPKAPA